MCKKIVDLLTYDINSLIKYFQQMITSVRLLNKLMRGKHLFSVIQQNHVKVIFTVNIVIKMCLFSFDAVVC